MAKEPEPIKGQPSLMQKRVPQQPTEMVGFPRPVPGLDAREEIIEPCCRGAEKES